MPRHQLLPTPACWRQALACAAALLPILATAGQTQDVAAATDPVTRAQQIVAQMSLAQKISEVHGSPTAGHARLLAGIPSLGIPQVELTNGPEGAANGRGVSGFPEISTAVPAPISLAASFDVSQADQVGAVLGNDAASLGYGIFEGPNINLARVPENGRTYQALGEDPYLIGQIASNEIQGVQAQNVIANVKHYAANNQETNRTTINEIIDERTLREIYLPGFETSVEQGQVGSVMCAYPQVNGTFDCQNSHLLGILKNDWGFQGFVLSDFGATHSTVASANAGMDLEMPSGNFFATPLQTAVQGGQVPTSRLDDMLVRRYSEEIRIGIFDHPNTQRTIPLQAEAAQERHFAEQGMVLLKNGGATLPLSPTGIHSVALIGPYASSATVGCGCVTQVHPPFTVSPTAGINSVAPGVAVTTNDGSNLTSAAAAARAADVAIVMLGNTMTEGHDLPNLSLPNGQDGIVSAVAAANPRTIVVLHTGTAVLMPWASQVPAIVEAWYPGEEDGNALADILFGKVSPSGKLPLTFPVANSDTPANTPAQWPGVNGTATYSEGLDVGYRHYDAAQIAPLFPFGFGLSYTTFAYDSNSLSVQPDGSGGASVTFNVTNTGTVAGAEVPQVYVSFPSRAGEPPKQLKGFTKILLQPGQTQAVTIHLDARAFQWWDTTSSSWTSDSTDPYQIMVGSSSRDLHLQASFSLSANPCPGGHTATGSPMGAAATALGGGQATITWTAPSATACAAAATYYAVYAYPQLAVNPIQVTAGTSLTMSGLTAGQFYTFTITAYNGIGWSAWSGWAPWTAVT